MPRTESKENCQLIHIVLTEAEDGHHNIESRIDVCDDHHFLDMLHHALKVWDECNHK
jgi:hypothetical protein